MAPEQLLSNAMTVSLAADIFSWGMLALEVGETRLSGPETI